MSKETDETRFKSFVNNWRLTLRLDSDHTWVHKVRMYETDYRKNFPQTYFMHNVVAAQCSTKQKMSEEPFLNFRYYTVHS